VAAGASIISSSPAFAAVGTCCNGSASYTLIGQCREMSEATAGCVTEFTNTVSVCRTLPNRTMWLARTTGNQFRPYFDEVGVLIVTSPTGVVRTQNFIGWQNDCRVASPTFADLTGYGDGNGTPCAGAANAPTNVTNMFGSECGIFSVRIEVRNSYTPYGYSTCYLIPG
jgi:hypothetical protein